MAPANPATPSPAPAPDYQSQAADLAQKYGLDPKIVSNMIGAESNWDPKAVSDKGAKGLAQLMPKTAKDMGVDIDDPQQNLEGGIKYLSQLYGKYKDYPKALAAYNAGPDVVDKAQGVPNIPETKAYVEKIMGGTQSAGNTYDAGKARAAGLSDEDILGYLAPQRDFDVQGALKAGYSPKELVDYLSTMPRKLGAPPPEAPNATQQAQESIKNIINKPSTSIPADENPSLGLLPGTNSPVKQPIQVTPGTEAKGPGVESEPSVPEIAAQAALGGVLPGGATGGVVRRVVTGGLKGAVSQGGIKAAKNVIQGKPVTEGVPTAAAFGAAGGGLAAAMPVPKLDDAMNTIEKSADDMMMAGTKVNAGKFLPELQKSLPVSKYQPISDAIRDVAKKQGVQITSMDPDDFLPFREAVHDAVPEAQRDAVWEVMSRDFRSKLPGNLGQMDQALGNGAKIVTPQAAPAPQVPSTAGSTVKKVAKAGAVTAGAGITGSFARYARNRMLWELLDRAKGMVFGSP